jgi:hypothetical protein
VVRKFDFGFGPGHVDGGCPLAFDLDNIDTGHVAPGTDARAPESCTTRSPLHIDDPGGRDNSFERLIETNRSMFHVEGDADTYNPNSRIANGGVSLLFQVVDYNGTADDFSAEVTILVTSGLMPQDAGEAGVVTTVPTWEAGEAWSVDPISIRTSTQMNFVGKYLSTEAYVSRHVLVAKFPSAPLPTSTSSATLLLEGSSSVLVARIVREGTSYRLDDGHLVGRIPTAEILAKFELFGDPTNTKLRICNSGSSVRDFLKSTICAGADINRTAANDEKGAPCDALSVAVGFTAVVAQIGGVYARVGRDKACDFPDGAPYADECDDNADR